MYLRLPNMWVMNINCGELWRSTAIKRGLIIPCGLPLQHFQRGRRFCFSKGMPYAQSLSRFAPGYTGGFRFLQGAMSLGRACQTFERNEERGLSDFTCSALV